MAFKMKGYSYPGQSPLKGKKKQAQMAAAGERRSGAYMDLQDSLNKETESTNLLAAGNPTVYGQIPNMPNNSPVQKRAPFKQPIEQQTPELDTKSNVEPEKADEINIPEDDKPPQDSNIWKGAGRAALEAGATALIQGGINAIFGAIKPKDKPKRKTGSGAAFSNVKIGRT